MPLYSLNLKLPAGLDFDQAGGFASALCNDRAIDARDTVPLAGTACRDEQNDAWNIQWLFATPPDPAHIVAILNDICRREGFDFPLIHKNDLVENTIPEDGWLTRSYRALEPFRESGFYIYSDQTEHPDPRNDIALQIDAAVAFGSGKHDTTAGCLALIRALYNNSYRPSNILDLGTGSGILALAAWSLWQVPVLATDIDKDAILAASRHRALNAVPDRAVHFICADGFHAPSLHHAGPFSLTIANILAGPLKELARDIVAHTANKGRIILSGLLEDQKDDVLAYYRDRHCTVL
jgi:ribosomal protein L11 methyltransferase